MDLSQQTQTVLGLDLGRIHTRAVLFGVVEGKYRLLGQGEAPSSMGAGRHLGKGVGEAIEALQLNCGRKLLNADGSLIQPAKSTGEGFDQMALTTSAGPRLKTVILGLTAGGSLKAAQALVDSLPLALVGAFSLGDLRDEAEWIDAMVQLRPELLVITGGETGGAMEPVARWVELTRIVVRLLPDEAKPHILYAGNPALWESVQRQLEPITPVQLTANLQPTAGEVDLVPAQALLNHFILQKWAEVVPGLGDLVRLAGAQASTTGFGMNRMARFLSRPVTPDPDGGQPRGVIAVDLGGNRTSVTVGAGGETFSVTSEAGHFQTDAARKTAVQDVHRWMSESVSPQVVAQYLQRRAMHPALVPTTPMELALEQAWDRSQLHQAIGLIAERFPNAPFDPEDGWLGHFEPIIASGAALTQAPHPGQAMLMLLDGLQPQGVTTLVLDRYHLLPLFGTIGATLPILPVQLLETDAFENLGTVITPVSPAPAGKKILTLQVVKEGGSGFSVDIDQGTLRRVVIQVNEPAILVLTPEPDTDVGFGAPGLGGRLKVTGGTLGVVVDARGRLLPLPEDDEERVALIQRWHWTLGS